MQSQNYAPSDALLPYVRRFYVFDQPLPDEMVIEDFLLAETAFVRILLKGDWTAEMSHGDWRTAGKCVFFGGNETPLKARVKGSFAVAGFAIRPSGWHALFTESHRKLKDQMLPLQTLWGDLADQMMAEVSAAPDDQGKIAAMERAITARLETIGKPKPDAQMAQFEVIARTDSMMRIEEAAEQIGLSVRQMERRCLASFGLSPKAILRRSRFLDMAAAMRGFSSPSQKELAALRYFDQSHINREFKRFSGMTPGKFAKAVTPLQTAGLLLREEGKAID